MPIWQLCANLLIPNCLRSNLSYSPLAALELYVKKTKSLIVPYLFFAIITNAVALILQSDSLSTKTWNNFFLSGSDTPLWFIYVLFIANVLYFMIERYISQKIVTPIIFVLVAISYIFDYINIGLPYKFEVVPIAIGFIFVGKIFCNLAINVKRYYKILLFVLYLIIIYLLKIRIDMRVNQEGIPLVSFILAVYGIVLTIWISQAIQKYKLLSMVTRYIGRNSLVVFGLSSMFLVSLKVLFSSLGFDGGISSIIRHALFWVTIPGFVNIIDRFLPWAAGKGFKHKKYEIHK